MQNLKQQKFSLIKNLHRFKFAFQGLKVLVKEEHSARIHLFATVCVLASGFIFKISAFEWMAIIFAAGLVISLETVNSSIENMADFISPEKHPRIKKIKDLAAASVLIGAITALAIGLIVFVPKIIILF